MRKRRRRVACGGGPGAITWYTDRVLRLVEVPNDEPDEIHGRSFDCSGRRHKSVSPWGVRTMAGRRPEAETPLERRRAGEFSGGDEAGHQAQDQPPGSFWRRQKAISGCAVRRVESLAWQDQAFT